jgi:hypothetical protein
MFSEDYLKVKGSTVLNILKQSDVPKSSRTQGPLKDFTLTNVRHSAKLSEIKKAIFKLKGFKIECQSLSLADEHEIVTKSPT